jgi:hypothetical protein
MLAWYGMPVRCGAAYYSTVAAKPFPSDPPYNTPCTEFPLDLPDALSVSFPSLPTEYAALLPLPIHDSSKQYRVLSAGYSSSHAGVEPHPVTGELTVRLPVLPVEVKLRVYSFPV